MGRRMDRTIHVARSATRRDLTTVVISQPNGFVSLVTFVACT